MGKLSLATCVRSWALAALSLATLSGATACQPDASPPQGSPPGTVARAASVEGETPNANPILTSPFRLPGTAVASRAYAAAGVEWQQAMAGRDFWLSEPSAGTARALNELHGFASNWRDSRLQLSSTASPAPWQLSFELTSLSRAGHHLPRELSRFAEDNTLQITREGGVREWYTNGPLGLEQGFELSAPPDDAGRAAGEWLKVRLHHAGDLRARQESLGIAFYGPSGERELTFNGLVAVDAQGRELLSRVELDGAEIALAINDLVATYPIQIDPLLSYASMTGRAESPSPAIGGQFGAAIDVSGTTAIVGAPAENGDDGAAHIYTLSGSTWTLQQSLTGPVTGGGFGQAVAIDGDLAIVGAPYGGGSTGAAYVYARSGSTWTQVESLAPPVGLFFGFAVDVLGTRLLVSGYGSLGDPRFAFVYDESGGDWTVTADLSDPSPGTSQYVFGSSVALGTDYAVVGSIYGNGTSTPAGAVTVFDGTDSWAATPLTSGDSLADDQFGYSVSTSGSRVVVGARNAESVATSADNRGAAYVFVESGGSWSLEQRLEADDPSGTGYKSSPGLFGAGVAISGTQIAVGAPGASADTTGSGGAYLFELSGGSWDVTEHFFGSSALSGAFFGRSVSLSAGTLVVGSYVEEGGAAQSGAAYSVSTSPAPTPTFDRLLGSKTSGIDAQGYAVAVAGNVAVVGAPGANSSRGAAYVYDYSGGTWTERGFLEASDGAGAALFGKALAISNDTVFVGAPAQGTSGKVYTFALTGISGDTTESGALSSPAPQSGAQFGFSLAVDGDTLVVGESARSSGGGAAYVFQRDVGVWDAGTALSTTPSAGDAIGSSVAILGDLIAVGAPGVASAEGRVLLYTRDVGGWSAQQTLVHGSPATGDDLGWSVAISGTDVLAGAPQIDGGGAGSAFVFSYGSGSWSQAAQLQAPAIERTPEQRIGISVAFDAGRALVAGRKKAYIFGKIGAAWQQDTTLPAGVASPQGAGLNGEQLLLGLSPVGVATFLSSGTLGSSCSANFDCLSDHCVSGSCVECTPASEVDDCDDGLFCNGAETCVGNACAPGSLSLDDSIDCTVDGCNEEEDAVTHTADDSACADGNACNGDETCNVTAGCESGTPIPTDDGVGCTIDLCNPNTGQVNHTPDNSACTDGDACNGAEYCDSILDCQAGVALAVDDGVACTTDTCNPATGQISHAPSHAACDNGEACDGTEVCDVTAGCVGGTPPDCDDGIECTVDSCAQSTCVHTPSDASCNGQSQCDGVQGCTLCATSAQECTAGSNNCSSICECAVGFVGNGTSCTADCGDGLVVSGEACDINAFGGATCESEGSATGTGGHLRCASDCRAIQTGTCDRDNDGVSDETDNCPSKANADQLDSDGDASEAGGNACDSDDDNDGVSDSADPAPLDPASCGDSDGDTCDDCTNGAPPAPDNDGKDTDGDGICDQGSDDWDGDGTANMADNCPEVANPLQTDSDGDGQGDACDADRDGDGEDNEADLCPDVPDSQQRDADGDGIGDYCDDSPGKHVVSVQLNPGAATTITLGALTVTVPAGAVMEPTRLVVYEDPATPEAPMDAATPVYTIETSTPLASDLTACLELDAEGAVHGREDGSWQALLATPGDAGEACASLLSGSVVGVSVEVLDPVGDDDAPAALPDASTPGLDGGLPDGVDPDLFKDGGLDLDNLTDEELAFLRDAGINPDDLDNLQDLLSADGGFALDGGIRLPAFPTLDTGCGCRVAARNGSDDRGAGLSALVLLAVACGARRRRRRGKPPLQMR